MQTAVTLTLYDEQTGQERRVNINSSRFTIGRLPENDLFIDDTNLSRRHAIIESFDGLVHISDCGSQNGTFVN
ncbi:MAG TPA: FHA domain-containing protein, partial [Pyrinomonadaceae bacterium]